MQQYERTKSMQERLHDDLDKDPDYSGSGFGPDDEDSSTDLQQSHRGTHTQSATTSAKQSPSITTTNSQNTPTLTYISTTSSATASKNRGSSLYPNQVQQTHLPAAPHYPAGHTDDEDFDLGEGDGVEDVDDERKQHIAGSGDGGDDEDDDDDDHTGDIDEDGQEGLIERPYQRQHEFGVDNTATQSTDSRIQAFWSINKHNELLILWPPTLRLVG
ncbi:unnamed protein product [Ceratitis capitata]|uniref:(Mediterranean fruit fly) hypothetical protein n=1 Tax=Ceratitis capitata TaxID=7213 RepID=A0A811VFY4_CERCA|nr:unnamed protein product [Ceratitis capitata]